MKSVTVRSLSMLSASVTQAVATRLSSTDVNAAAENSTTASIEFKSKEYHKERLKVPISLSVS